MTDHLELQQRKQVLGVCKRIAGIVRQRLSPTFRASASARASSNGPEQAFRALIETYKQAGYGDIEVVDFDLSKPEAHLRGKNMLESSAAQRSGIYRSPRAVDYRGDDACEFTILGLGGTE